MIIIIIIYQSIFLFSFIGTGVWDRSAMEEEFMYRDNFMGPSQREVGFESLGLFRTHVRYNIRL